MRTKTLPLAALVVSMIAMLGGLPSMAADKLTEKEAAEIGTDAYIFGYPLVTVEYTRRVTTNAVEPKGLRAPMGQFANSRTYPDASFKDVTAPNADTLYSSAWLDLAKEPYILSLPDEGDRYFLIPMLDARTTVFQVPGKRTTGDKAQTYAITGPNWKGELPKGVTEYKSPTNLVWIIGRTYCTGTPADYEAVHALQDKYSLVTLSGYGKPYTPPKGKVDPNIDMKTAVRDQVNKLDAGAYFKLMAALMKNNPPTKDDAPMVAKMAKIGLVPGQDFDIGKLDPAAAKGLQGVPKASVREDHGFLYESRHSYQRLDVHDQGGDLRHRLLGSGLSHGHRPWRQSPPGCGLPDLGSRCRWQALQRRQQVRHALRQGPDTACRRLLVADDVQRRILLCGQ